MTTDGNPNEKGPPAGAGHAEVRRQGEAAPPTWHCQSRQQGWYQVNSRKEPSLDHLEEKKGSTPGTQKLQKFKTETGGEEG